MVSQGGRGVVRRSTPREREKLLAAFVDDCELVKSAEARRRFLATVTGALATLNGGDSARWTL